MSSTGKNTNQMDRFSSGFYNYDILDRILLKTINGRVPKHLRGSELKKMAILYLMNNEPELYQQLHAECLAEMQQGENSTITNQTPFPVRPVQVTVQEFINPVEKTESAISSLEADDSKKNEKEEEKVVISVVEEKTIDEKKDETSKSSYFDNRGDIDFS